MKFVNIYLSIIIILSILLLNDSKQIQTVNRKSLTYSSFIEKENNEVYDDFNIDDILADNSDKISSESVKNKKSIENGNKSNLDSKNESFLELENNRKHRTNHKNRHRNSYESINTRKKNQNKESNQKNKESKIDFGESNGEYAKTKISDFDSSLPEISLENKKSDKNRLTSNTSKTLSKKIERIKNNENEKLKAKLYKDNLKLNTDLKKLDNNIDVSKRNLESKLNVTANNQFPDSKTEKQSKLSPNDTIEKVIGSVKNTQANTNQNNQLQLNPDITRKLLQIQNDKTLKNILLHHLKNEENNDLFVGVENYFDPYSTKNEDQSFTKISSNKI